MSWTKGALVGAAFEELGMAQYKFDLQPEQIQSAVNTLDGMMALLASSGLNLSYNQGTNTDDSDESDSSGLPMEANEAVYMNLALRLAGRFGKQPKPTTVMFADRGLKTLFKAAVRPTPEVQLPATMPRGAGNRRGFWRPFYPQPNLDPIQTGQNGDLEFLGD